jgi:hypothetical protein
MKNPMILVLAVGAVALLGGNAASAAPGNVARTLAGPDSSQASDVSARKKVKRMSQHRMHRHYRESYGYERGWYPGQGYYRGVQPGYGYGPDYGDRAWPPFHFRPYW